MNATPSRGPEPDATRSRLEPPADWLSMGEASALLGVSPATLRRWVAEGRVVALTTPGGHHRLNRSVVEALLPHVAPATFPAAAEEETVDQIHRAYRDAARDPGERPAFLEDVPQEAREPLRAYGRMVTSSILRYLETPAGDAREAALAEGLIAAAAYGRIAESLGASMRETVRTFLRFRMPFVHEMAGAAGRQGLDALGAAELLEAVTVAVDRLLDATLEGWEHATLPRRPRRDRRPRVGR